MNEARADLQFYFDPICPFAWMTSKWVRLVMAARDYSVEWRLISLRLINADVDYTAHFPPEYEAAHMPGCGCCGLPRGRGPNTVRRRSIGSRLLTEPTFSTARGSRRNVRLIGREPHVAEGAHRRGFAGNLVETL